jgi:GDP/UDP-N,N'-diacetylbacillosamine 2-epimerase (hydrolysing)
MPNADTSGNVIRSIFNTELKDLDHITLIENFGTQSYFTCMKYCSFLLGNTSSGIIEAASFGKMVINIGNRQEGRFSGENVINCKIVAEDIERAISAIEMNVETSYQNPYWNGGAADKIINILQEQA